MRHHLIFVDGVRTKKENVEFLIVQRSRAWCSAINLFEDSTLWNVNPVGTILRSNTRRLAKLMDVDAEIMGFIDGAWKCGNDKRIQAGIGGYLKDKQGNLLFLFSGPSTAKSAFDCELDAMIFLVRNIFKSPWRLSKCVLYTDSVELVRTLKDIKFKLLDKEEDVRNLLRSCKVEFKKIDRILNCEADKLAKQGRLREKILFAWC